MICEYIEGKHKNKLKNKDIKNLSTSLKKLHKIKVNAKTLKLKNEFKKYKLTLKDNESNKLINSSLQEIKKLKKYKKELVLCHHDLNKENILFHKNKVKFIDWEFSCINDRFFDLANICVEFNLNKKQEKYLLKNYLGKEKKINIKKLDSYKTLYKNLWKLWFKSLEK